MKKLNITSEVLDALGFSEYDDDNGTSGSRILRFKNGVAFKVTEQCEMEDIHEGYASRSGEKPLYVANHWTFTSTSGSGREWELFFLHNMYICINVEFASCLPEFIEICKSKNMYPYIENFIENAE